MWMGCGGDADADGMQMLWMWMWISEKKKEKRKNTYLLVDADEVAEVLTQHMLWDLENFVQVCGATVHY